MISHDFLLAWFAVVFLKFLEVFLSKNDTLLPTILLLTTNLVTAVQISN